MHWQIVHGLVHGLQCFDCYLIEGQENVHQHCILDLYDSINNPCVNYVY